MISINRREVLKLAATASVGAIAAPAIGQTAPDKRQKDMTPAEEHADRDRVIAAGLTDAEADCWEIAGQLAGKLFGLPKLHVMDDQEITHAIHLIQYRLLARPAYRKYLEVAKAAAGRPEDKK